MNNRDTLWVEKYRPKTLNEISAQKNVINILKTALVCKNIPHLLFLGTVLLMNFDFLLL